MFSRRAKEVHKNFASKYKNNNYLLFVGKCNVSIRNTKITHTIRRTWHINNFQHPSMNRCTYLIRIDGKQKQADLLNSIKWIANLPKYWMKWGLHEMRTRIWMENFQFIEESCENASHSFASWNERSILMAPRHWCQRNQWIRQ